MLSSAVDRREVLGVAVGEWGNDKECDWWWLRGEKQKRELPKSSLLRGATGKRVSFLNGSISLH